MAQIKIFLDWLFKDLHGRRGGYVIAEVPNFPLILFMLSIILALFFNPGAGQVTLVCLAYLALAYWGWQEWRSGRSRFRKLLGILGILSVIGALLMRIGF